MTENAEAAVKDICAKHGNDPVRLMDMIRDVQQAFQCVNAEAVDTIASTVGCPRVEVHSAVSFYAFLTEQPTGEVVVRVCNDVVDKMMGVDRVAEAFKEALGIDFGQTTPDGKISLEWTPCIGMSDQAPAVMVNDEILNWVSPDSARKIAEGLKKHGDPKKLIQNLGDGNNAHDLVRSRVVNNVRKAGEVVLAEIEPGAALKNALAMSPAEVIRDINTARLRGRGGAGFPTGMKWNFTRQAEGDRKFVLCNADEGEPGTFKDRVVLTERSDLLFEGMTIAGYAVGSDTGVLYLRAEYAYLREFLEAKLDERRAAGLLGENVCGKDGFAFDIRIQMGAGAYVCGEETALISSCEGKRGDPKNRPPFPAQKGFMDYPTVVNNVETFCCAARILEKSPGWFAQLGSSGSPGTKLLSVCGDCMTPGVYEVPFGIEIHDLLKMVGAPDAKGVLVGGPSGQILDAKQFSRTICYDDLGTGGSVVIFGPDRDLLDVASQYMEFFIEESCGYCTPCRVGNQLLKERLDAIRAGEGTKEDLDYLWKLCKTVKTASRCGLGQTSPNPVLSTLENFPEDYQQKLVTPTGPLRPTFDPKAALADAEAIAGRDSEYFHQPQA